MKLDQFPGLNTVADSYEIGLGGLVQADNVDLSQNGNISRRAGRTKVYSGTIDAAWGDGLDFLFVEGGKLKTLNADYSATDLASVSNNVSTLYVLRTVAGLLYWSTGVEHGVIEDGVNRNWFSADDSYWTGTEDEEAVASEIQQDAMPVGKQMVEYMGRIWMVYEGMLIYTDPYSEATDLRENFIPVGKSITNFGAVSDGLLITTETDSYFYAGRDPAEMTVIGQAPFGAIPNTMVQVDGRILGEGQNTIALLWASSYGVCAAYPNGTLVNMTQNEIKELAGVNGTALLRELNGQRHYIAVLQN